MINFLFQKRKPLLNLSSIGTDIHSHLVAGIDDGSKDIETSLELMKKMEDMGFNKIITTPHVMSGQYPNTSQDILKGLDSLKTALQNADTDVSVLAAAEYFLDEDFLKLLDSKDLLTLPNNHLLVEMSLLSPFDGLYDYIFKIALKGYKIILAHPERYNYYHDNYKEYYRIKEKGVLFQVNILSFLGYYGKNIKKIAYELVKDNMVEVLGTDIHHARHANFIKENINNKEFQNILSKYEFQNSTLFS